MGREQMRGEEPSAQRQVRRVHDGAGGGGSLLVTASAFEGGSLGLQSPAFNATAVRAGKAVRPALGDQIFGARCVVREGRHELLQRRRFVVLPASGLLESSHGLSLSGVLTPSH